MRLPVHHDYSAVIGNPFLAFLVHLNVWFSIPMYLVVAWAFYFERLNTYSMDEWQRSWYGSLVGVWTMTELPRLYFGYKGNVSQSVSHLFGFVALTFITHFALTAAYLVLTPYQNSLDFSLGTLGLIFGLFEAILGVYTLRQLLWTNTMNFYVQLGAQPAESRSTPSS